MYEPQDPAAEAGARAFRELLKEWTGYPERWGGLEAFGKLCGIQGPTLGKYIRGETVPTDNSLRKIAAAKGVPYMELYGMLHPVDGQAVPAPAQDEVSRLSTILDEAQKIINGMRTKAVQSSIANERRNKRTKTKIHPRMNLDDPSGNYAYKNVNHFDSRARQILTANSVA